MKYRIYEINDRDKIYYIVKKWKYFFWGTAKTNRLSTFTYDSGGGSWYRKEFSKLDSAMSAVIAEIEYLDKPKWKKVVADVDSDRDFPNI